MKKYAIIAAALLWGAGCQSRDHGTAGTGVQSGAGSSSSNVFDSTANHRDALQDNSSALKERSGEAPPVPEINPDVGAPGLKNDTGSALQPDQNKPDESLTDPNRDRPIHQEDADATLRPVAPVRPYEQAP